LACGRGHGEGGLRHPPTGGKKKVGLPGSQGKRTTRPRQRGKGPMLGENGGDRLPDKGRIGGDRENSKMGASCPAGGLYHGLLSLLEPRKTANRETPKGGEAGKKKFVGAGT